MYIAYINTPSGNPITQIHEITEVTVQSRLNDTGSGSFFIRWDNPNNTPEVLQEFNRVRLYKQFDTGEEKLLIDGYMKSPECDNGGTTVYIGDMVDFLKTKFLGSAKTYTGKTLDYIVNDVIDDINSRFSTGIVVDCGVTTIIPNKSYFEGQDIFSIFSDIVDSGYEFKVQNSVLYFKETVGIDRTISGDSYVEYKYDKDNSNTININNPKTIFNAENIANYIKVKNGSSIVTRSDTPSISTYGSVERFFSSSGTDNSTANEILSERKESVREIDFTPIVQNYFEVDLGDTVQVYINSQNIMNNYTGSSKIVEKKYTSGDLESTVIKVSTSKVKTLSLLEQISKLKEKQKLQEF